jgi:hydroxyacylglutathione hydrolase
MYRNQAMSMAQSAAQVFLLKMAKSEMKNNNYLVVDPASHQAVVIDPAWEMDKIEQSLIATRATLSGVLLTHSHFDHIHLAKQVAEFYNCPIWMSKREIAVSGFDARQLIGIDETPWSVGNMQIQPILTPGHTPGCVCYLIGDNLFTGDVLFAEGCGICGDLAAAYDMYASLEKLKVRVPLHSHVFPGHTYVRPPGQKFAEVLRFNMYLQFTDRESFAAYRLRKGQTKLLDFI